MALPPQRINLATNPGLEAGGASTAIRTNLSRNPSAGTNTTDWFTTAGGGTPTLSRVATGGPTGFPTFARGTAATAGWTYLDIRTGGVGVNLVTAGSTYTASAFMRSSLAGPVTVYLQWLDAAEAVVTTTSVAVGNNTANTWERFSATGVAPALATHVLVIFRVATATAAGSTIDLTGKLLELAEGAGIPFDGATAAAGDFTYGWTGTAHASTSTQRVIQPTGFSAVAGAGGAGFVRRTADSPYAGTYCARYEWTKAGTSGSAGVIYQHTQSGVAGDVRSGRIRVRSSVPKLLSFLFRFRNNTTVVGNTQTAYVTIPANTWTEFTVDGLAATGAYTNIQCYALIGNSETQSYGDTFDMDMVLVEDAPVSGPAFDGSSTDTHYTHAWTGAANASTSTRDYYGIWAEQVETAGAPRAQITVIGMGGTSVVTQVTRQCGREEWSVPGWKKRNTLDGDTFTDFTPPLGRPVTYTLTRNGQAINSITITVDSATGWVQDPLSPESAMPVSTTEAGPTILTLAKAALKKVTYGAQYAEETPLGGQYPIIRANQRSGPAGVEFHLNAYSNVTSDALQQLVLDTPILLFRGLPSWGSIPALAYLIGDVEEAPYNRDRGGEFTTWMAGGKLSTPVALAPLTGNVTNQMVEDNLAGRTHASIEATSGNLRNIDVQANPLGLGQ